MKTSSPIQQPDGPRTAGLPFEPTILREALFASHLQSSQHPSARDVRAAIANTLSALGVGLCTARVAQEFGDHPETATIRMRWASHAVAAAYRDIPVNQRPGPPRRAAGGCSYAEHGSRAHRSSMAPARTSP